MKRVNVRVIEWHPPPTDAHEDHISAADVVIPTSVEMIIISESRGTRILGLPVARESSQSARVR
jgi:hypothetical protein